MSRIRTIKPEFPQSESVGQMSRDARLLFIQLWTLVDDAGRTRAASRMLASLLYPYDDDAKGLIDGWLDELERGGNIRRYEVNGSHYLEIDNWLIHQKIDHASKSRLPSPDDNFAKPRETSRTLAPDLGPGPFFLSSLSSSEDSLSEERKLEEEKARGRFDEFWKEYPHKIGKSAARKSFQKALKRVNFKELMEALERYKNKTDDRPWCNPETWLNQDRWTDEPAEINGGNGNGKTAKRDGLLQACDRALEYLKRPDGRDSPTIEGTYRLLPDDGNQ